MISEIVNANFAKCIIPILKPSLTRLTPVDQEQLCKMKKAAIGRHGYVMIIARTFIVPDHPTCIPVLGW